MYVFNGFDDWDCSEAGAVSVTLTRTMCASPTVSFAVFPVVSTGFDRFYPRWYARDIVRLWIIISLMMITQILFITKKVIFVNINSTFLFEQSFFIIYSNSFEFQLINPGENPGIRPASWSYINKKGEHNILKVLKTQERKLSKKDLELIS